MDSRELTSDPIRVIIADDHELFREGVASLLERADDISLIGEASNGEKCILMAEELLPDIILMDVNMPGLGGIEATKTVVERNPTIGVIIVTMYEDDETVVSALKAGARGYVLKDAKRGTLLRAIRAVAHGEALLSPSVAQKVLDQFAALKSQSDLPEPSTVANHSLFKGLTRREAEVLKLITQGLRNREIAEKLVISEKTVGNHISNIFSKLHVNDRSQAILRALNEGLLNQSPKTEL